MENGFTSQHHYTAFGTISSILTSLSKCKGSGYGETSLIGCIEKVTNCFSVPRGSFLIRFPLNHQEQRLAWGASQLILTHGLFSFEMFKYTERMK